MIASIDQNGLLISTDLVNLNNTQADIDTNLCKVLDAFSLFREENKTNLEAINATIAALNPVLEELGVRITTHIDIQTGELLTAITLLGNDLAGSIEEQTTALNTAIANNAASIVSSNNAIKDAINNKITELQNSSNENADAQIALLNQMLEDDGVYEGDNCIYMTPEIWASVEAAGPSSSIYKSFAAQLQTIYPSITTVQVTPGDQSSWHTCAQFYQTGEDSPILVGGSMQPMTLANGKTVLRVIKTPGTLYYRVTTNGCAYPIIYQISVSDARAPQPGNIYNARTEWTGSATEATDVKLYTFYNGTIVTNISTWAYSREEEIR